MANGTLFNGSICLTDLIAFAKEKHSAFNKANNGKIYVNINIWLNDEIDQYDNIGSLQLQKKKDSDDKQHYIGNFRPTKARSNEITNSDVDALEDIESDLPF